MAQSVGIEKYNTIIIRSLLVLLLYAVYLHFNDYQSVLYYDSLDYFKSGSGFFKEGHLTTFSFLNYQDPLRGYLFPLINLPINILSSYLGIKPIVLAKIQGAFFAALLFGYALPEFWAVFAGRQARITWAGFAILVGISFLFWRDHFTFTLTDFPAILAVLAAFVLLHKPRVLAWLLAGVLVSAAVNLRPIYVVIIPFFAAAIVVKHFGTGKAKKLLPIFFPLGMLVIMLPQFLINVQNFNSASPFVLGKKPEGVNLYQWHLAWGMRIQKFETLYPESAVPFYVADDPAGVALLEKVNHSQGFKSMGEYVQAVVTYPYEFAALYGRHLFNDLDVKYPVPYILKPGFYWQVSVLNYIMLFVGAVLFTRVVGRLTWPGVLMLLGLLLVVVVSLPLVPECRFALPVYFLLLCAVAFSKPIPVLWRFLRRRRRTSLTLAASCLIWVVLCLTISTHTQSLTLLKQAFNY